MEEEAEEEEEDEEDNLEPLKLGKMEASDRQGRIRNGKRAAKTGAMAYFDYEELEVQVPASDVKPEAPVKPEVKALSMAWLSEANETSETAKEPSSLQPEEVGRNFNCSERQVQVVFTG